MRRSFVAVLALSSLCTHGAFADEHEGQPTTAFVFESRLAGGFSLLGAAGYGGGAALIPGLMVGARLANRVNIGLDFFLAHYSLSGNGGGAGLTAFTFGALATVDILQAHHNKVAFYGKAGLALGDGLQSQNNGGGSTTTNNNFLGKLDLGLGVRYVPVSYFAFGMESGVLTIFVGTNNTTAIASVYGGIVGTFMYGK